MSAATATAPDPGATIRGKSYRVLLVFAALIGVLVSFASWCFLELVHWIQQEVYKSLPSGLGLHPVPWWWPLPVLAVAGVLAAVAIVRLPGHGGHIPYEGIKTAHQRAEVRERLRLDPVKHKEQVIATSATRTRSMVKSREPQPVAAP